jgi:hypothetical protein
MRHLGAPGKILPTLPLPPRWLMIGPDGHGRYVCFCYICFLRRGRHGAMSEANSKDNG